MKLLLPPIALVLLASAPRDGTTLAYAPEEGTVLKRVFEAKAEYHLAEIHLSFGDETRDAEEVPDYKDGFTEHIAVTDHLVAVADGHPTELVRTFDELGQDSSASQDDEEHQSSSTSPLEGRSVRFTWDTDASAFRVAADDKKDLDEAQAAELLEDMDLRLVLPSKEVSPGDEWDVDPKLYLAFMWPSGLLDFHGEGDGSEEIERARQTSHQSIEHLEGTGTARLEEVREEGGLRVAAIHVELSIRTGSEHLMEAEGEGEDAHPEIRFSAAIEREVAGTILWDLEHGHFHSAELECKAKRTDSRSGNLKDPDGNDVTVAESRVYEGTIHYDAKVERE